MWRAETGRLTQTMKLEFAFCEITSRNFDSPYNYQLVDVGQRRFPECHLQDQLWPIDAGMF
jgi:hypothetical protein